MKIKNAQALLIYRLFLLHMEWYFISPWFLHFNKRLVTCTSIDNNKSNLQFPAIPFNITWNRPQILVFTKQWRKIHTISRLLSKTCIILLNTIPPSFFLISYTMTLFSLLSTYSADLPEKVFPLPPQMIEWVMCYQIGRLMIIRRDLPWHSQSVQIRFYNAKPCWRESIIVLAINVEDWLKFQMGRI